MLLAGPSPLSPPPTDVADALARGAAALGHRPAVTVLHPGARYEQSGASLANWAGKGAHLLELDHLVGPGTVVGIDAPACWTTAAVALATWWLGGCVRPGADPTDAVTVGHLAGAVDAPDAPLGGIEPALVVGDGLDGAPVPPGRHAAFTHEAQPLPDHPPGHHAAPDAVALVSGGRSWTQAELLARAATLGTGTLGLEADRTDPVTALVAVALRPLVTGAATVVLRGVAREAAAGERVSAWCPTSDG